MSQKRRRPTRAKIEQQQRRRLAREHNERVLKDLKDFLFQEVLGCRVPGCMESAELWGWALYENDMMAILYPTCRPHYPYIDEVTGRGPRDPDRALTSPEALLADVMKTVTAFNNVRVAVPCKDDWSKVDVQKLTKVAR